MSFLCFLPFLSAAFCVFMTAYIFYSCFACFCCIGRSFLSTMSRDCLRNVSEITFVRNGTHSVTHSCPFHLPIHLPIPLYAVWKLRSSGWLCLWRVFTAQCEKCKARLCYRLSSVRLSVTLVDHDHISWKSFWKLIARTTSPASSLFVAKRSSTDS